jgi:hypothetical protein
VHNRVTYSTCGFNRVQRTTGIHLGRKLQYRTVEHPQTDKVQRISSTKGVSMCANIK